MKNKRRSSLKQTRAKNMLPGPDGMVYKDHLLSGIERGVVAESWKTDLISSKGVMKDKTISIYDL